MIEQSSLFDETAPHNRTSTSIDAAIEIQSHLNRLEQLVFDAVRESHNGLTRDELTEVTGLKTATVCARCNALVKKERLRSKQDENGKKITRPTSSGRKAEVLFWNK
tara:strand:- start:312 stop:632 length:321 start_codon:yes stop_codon:yes gene_type:complete